MGSRRGHGLSLAERAALSGNGPGAGTATGPGEGLGSGSGAGGGTGPGAEGGGQESRPGPAPAPATATARHCWVVDPPEAPGRWPGLLAEWRRAPDGLWEGRVVYAVLTAGRCVLVEGWLGMHRLEQA